MSKHTMQRESGVSRCPLSLSLHIRLVVGEVGKAEGIGEASGTKLPGPQRQCVFQTILRGS